MPHAFRRPLLLALAALLLGVGLFGSGAVVAHAASAEQRLSGDDRYATSAAVSKAEHPTGADTVFLATGQDFADALAAGPAAATVNAPILLATRSGLPEATATELARLRPSRIFIVGGEPSLGQAVIDAATALTSSTLRGIERIAGPSRQATAIALASRFLPGAGEVFLVNGWRYPDALTAASAGANRRIPVLLTSGDTLAAETASYLQQSGPGLVTILGSNLTVDNRVMRLAGRSSGGQVQRLGGADRFETNAQVVERYFDTSGDGIALATGHNFPDALVATIMSDRGIPVILTADRCAATASIAQVRRLALDAGETIRIVGARVASSVWTVECPASTAPVRDCSIQAQLSDPAALTVSARYMEEGSSTALLDRRAGSWAPSASTMKLVTAITAFSVLGPDFQIPTYLFHGTKPGSFVVSGMGDPTLRSGYTSVYGSAPSMVNIAAAAKNAGATVASYDSWLFTGPTWHPNWASYEREAGSAAPVEALMMDGGRIDPNASYSSRTANPAWDAGARFAQLAGVPFDPTIRADPSQGIVGVVYSQPVRTLVSQMLLESDNMIAEALARLVAVELGYGGSYDAVAPAQAEALARLGLDPSGLQASDGSGLSSRSLVEPQFMDQVLELIGDGVAPYGQIFDMLPSNGYKGTLQFRLMSVPTGAIDAKTGSVDYGYGLAGFMTLPDGQRIRFSTYVWKSSGDWVTSTNRNALDRIVAAAYGCGTRLSNW